MRENVDFYGLLKIFTFDNKKQLQKYLNQTTIYQSDFTSLILACERGILPFHHEICVRDITSEDIAFKESKVQPLFTSGVGPFQKNSQKAIRHVFNFFEKRCHLVGHMFSTEHEWHFFYFDNKDMEEKENHFDGGSHIHFCNWLWPNYSAEIIWQKFLYVSDRPKRTHHVKYQKNQLRP